MLCTLDISEKDEFHDQNLDNLSLVMVQNMVQQMYSLLFQDRYFTPFPNVSTFGVIKLTAAAS